MCCSRRSSGACRLCLSLRGPRGEHRDEKEHRGEQGPGLGGTFIRHISRSQLTSSTNPHRVKVISLLRPVLYPSTLLPDGNGGVLATGRLFRYNPPAFPQPITVQIPAAAKEKPAPTATAGIPQADLPALRDPVEQCQECSVKLSTAQADLSATNQQLDPSSERLVRHEQGARRSRESRQGRRIFSPAQARREMICHRRRREGCARRQALSFAQARKICKI